MDPATSFPYTPFFHTAADATAKTPAWLNDPLMYHNRGDSTFAGESSTYGDFSGLDDLFTERPEVVKGMGDIYKKWVDFGIDGFRIDTVKHVNIEFWQKFVPDILAEATKVKNDDFFAFGEVYDGNPAVMSQYTTEGKLQATLDFGFQQQGVDFAKGKPANVLADFFSKDDWYTDADSNAYQLPTFLGNHDMGRASMFLKADGQSEAEHLKRVEFANSLMFTSRGNPVTYYGDEQGFVSTGGDQAAREDMFASKVDLYNTETVLGGPEGSMDRYNTQHPLYQQHRRPLRSCARANPALADGAQVNRFAADGAGIFATSRIGAGTKGGKNAGQVEYVVAANNDTKAATRDLPDLDQGQGRGLHAGLRHRQGRQARRRRLGEGHRAAADRERVEGQQADLHLRCGPDRRDGAGRRWRLRPHRGQGRRAREHLRADHVPVAQGRRDDRGTTSAPTTTRRSASSTTCPASRSPRRSSTARSSRMPRVASPATRPPPRWSSPRPRPCPSSATRRPPSRAASPSPAR